MRGFGLGLALSVLCLLLPGLCGAGELTMDVGELVLCAAIKERTPVGVADTFPSDIFSIYCFTRITGARDTAVVTHRWLYGEKEMAEVDLPVKSSSWRTWSSKRMLPEWQGDWKVEILSPEGEVIASKKFFVK
jgi:hypothetical protein